MSGALLTDILVTCRTVLAQSGGIVPGLFLIGLIGGLTHCVAQCGVFAVTGPGLKRGAERGGRARLPRRVRGGDLLAYHAGRCTTYALLAALAALTGRILAAGPVGTSFTVLMSLLAGVCFLLAALDRLDVRRPVLFARVWSRVRLPAGVTGIGPFPLGLLLGLMPCALSAGAVLAAAASGQPLAAAAGMAAFGAGTAVSLMVVTLGLDRLPVSLPARARGLGFLCGFNAIFLFALAGRALIRGV